MVSDDVDGEFSKVLKVLQEIILLLQLALSFDRFELIIEMDNA